MKKIFCCAAFVALFFCCRKDTGNDVPLTPNAANLLATGKSGHDFLSSATYGTLNIEIQYAPGMKPQDQSIINLVAFLNNYLNKPGGINVSLSQVASTDSANVTTQTVANFEKRHRVQYNNGNAMAVYIFFADAGYTTLANVVGVAYRNTSMVVFQKTIQEKTTSVLKRVQLESGVMEHEFGHLLGLVNVGTPMVADHEDAANKGHCNNNKCLMYYQIEANGLMNMAAIPLLDANCAIDLHANGGK